MTSGANWWGCHKICSSSSNEERDLLKIRPRAILVAPKAAEDDAAPFFSLICQSAEKCVWSSFLFFFFFSKRGALLDGLKMPLMATMMTTIAKQKNSLVMLVNVFLYIKWFSVSQRCSTLCSAQLSLSLQSTKIIIDTSISPWAFALSLSRLSGRFYFMYFRNPAESHFFPWAPFFLLLLRPGLWRRCNIPPRQQKSSAGPEHRGEILSCYTAESIGTWLSIQSARIWIKREAPPTSQRHSTGVRPDAPWPQKKKCKTWAERAIFSLRPFSAAPAQ